MVELVLYRDGMLPKPDEACSQQRFRMPIEGYGVSASWFDRIALTDVQRPSWQNESKSHKASQFSRHTVLLRPVTHLCEVNRNDRDVSRLYNINSCGDSIF